jgi:hypothetical protein
MSLHPRETPPVPEETHRIAQAGFPRGNVYIRMRHELGGIYYDQLFAPLFPARGQPAASPWPRPYGGNAICRGLVRPPGRRGAKPHLGNTLCAWNRPARASTTRP